MTKFCCSEILKQVYHVCYLRTDVTCCYYLLNYVFAGFSLSTIIHDNCRVVLQHFSAYVMIGLQCFPQCIDLLGLRCHFGEQLFYLNEHYPCARKAQIRFRQIWECLDEKSSSPSSDVYPGTSNVNAGRCHSWQVTSLLLLRDSTFI